VRADSTRDQQGAAMSDMEVFDRVMGGRGTIPFRDLQRLLDRLGFKLVRIKGSYHIYQHPKVSRHLNIQSVGKDAKRYQINQLRNIIIEFGLSLEGQQ
jgi:predicted RNA binding protein YcfA (HicA-like mRNA interferase family)